MKKGGCIHQGGGIVIYRFLVRESDLNELALLYEIWSLCVKSLAQEGIRA